jgi:hypothetical protein
VSTIAEEAKELAERARSSLEARARLGEGDLWTTPGGPVWKAERFEGRPSFYPVYRYRDYYSYSPLSLILLKGSLRLDPQLARRVQQPGPTYCSSTRTLDLEIERVGGPPDPRFEIRTPEAYAEALAVAMQRDVERIERANPGRTQVILCGGRDSLNMLLLRWSNPAVVLSAPPNFESVRRFVVENDLPFQVLPLSDENDSLCDLEILLNACRNDLQHCRWGPALRAFAREHDGEVVFWKGQIGNLLMTPQWRF